MSCELNWKRLLVVGAMALALIVAPSICEAGPTAPAKGKAKAPPRAGKVATAKATAKTKPRYKRVQKLIFGDDVVDAGTDKPDGVVVHGNPRSRHSSLIKVRANFIPELLKSAEGF